MQLVETVASNAKFHSSQDRTNQSTVTNVFQSINQKARGGSGGGRFGGRGGWQRWFWRKRWI